MSDAGAPPPDPAVPQELYDEHYYLELADGHEEFAAGRHGRALRLGAGAARSCRRAAR